ncbi:TPA: cytosine deaminase [Candidatus Bathyarchaeota archaeon]|nr:cytosine deaminase [Candidatus Bathyarchaeota archaeon]
MSLVIRNARLRGYEKPRDILVEDGRIARIADRIATRSDREIDAQGRLTSPAFIDPHIHLDKILIGEVARPNVSGSLWEAIEIMWELKREYTVEDVKRRAERVVEWAVMNGTTRIRTHVDVDTIAGLTPLRALLELRRECADIADVQIVAFPQEGIVRDEGAEELLRKAMDMGADVVGGMPHAEMTDDDSKRHVDVIFEIAKEYDADIDAHVDETDDPYSRCLEYIACKTVREKYQGRVMVDHACALASYDDYHAERVIRWLKEAGINVETNPETNVVLQGRLDTYPKRRGLTRVKQLLRSGINVTYGQDCIKDTFYPFGQADMLEVGFVLALLEQMTLPQEINAVFDMATVNAAKAIGAIDDYGIEVGKRADIVVIDAESVQEALRVRPSRLYVIRNGRIVAEGRATKRVIRAGQVP